VVGPFLLYGDRELLGRVRAALSDWRGDETVTGAEPSRG
jgi:hypothetical protein